MNREIKFRVWNNKLKKMYSWEIIRNSSLADFIEEEHYILMQYSGFKDMNGNDIYEGDYLMVEDFKNGGYIIGKQPRRKIIVEYRIDGSIGFKSGFNIIHTKNMEIIGNIYENE